MTLSRKSLLEIGLPHDDRFVVGKRQGNSFKRRFLDRGEATVAGSAVGSSCKAGLIYLEMMFLSYGRLILTSCLTYPLS
ncbi:MAG: hypothetical protein ACYCQJ_13295, partial [Nitrososphaerales archaeon]